jgi:hypothetical protein
VEVAEVVEDLVVDPLHEANVILRSHHFPCFLGLS